MTLTWQLQKVGGPSLAPSDRVLEVERPDVLHRVAVGHGGLPGAAAAGQVRQTLDGATPHRRAGPAYAG